MVLNPEQFAYRGLHQPSMGPPIHNLLEPENEEHDWSAPEDVYEHPHYYAERTRSTAESVRALQGVRGKADHPVTIYRAAPRGVTHLNPGDWVTPSPTYAREHGFHATDKDKDWPVYKAKVPARHVRWAGDSLNEFGYSGPPVPASLHFRGGANAEGVS